MPAAFPVRSPRFDFSATPRWWHVDSRFATAMANGMNFVFPAGERFFIRSVRHFLDEVDDPELKARAAAFIGQEAQHQRGHLAAFAALEEQGFEIRSFLASYERQAYEIIEPRVPPTLRLATTAALEHFTATFAELALDTALLDDSDPAMRDLLRWHAAEEIEHRAVAFDVLGVVDGRLRVRVAGFAMALGVLTLFWAQGVRHLLRQDPKPHGYVDPARARMRAYWRQHGPRFLQRLLMYLRRGFHPDQLGSDALAAAHIAQMQAAGLLAA